MSRRLDDKFWQRANTTLALIRAGYTTRGELAEWLGVSKTATWLMIRKLIELGWVAQKTDSVGTLHLIGPGLQMAPYLVLAWRKSDGTFEKLPPRRGGLC